MTTPKPEIGKILTEAYQYWMRTLPFQLMFTVIYFSIYMFAAMYAFRYYGLFEEIQKFQNLFYSDSTAFLTKYAELMQTENAVNFSIAVLIIKSVIYPLNIGFLKIYRKLDIGEPLELSDLFAGFRGYHFIIFVAFALIWNFINNYLFILSLVWMPMFLLVPALIFFKNYNFFDAFKLSFEVFKKHTLLLLGVALVSIIISFSGIIVFFFGLFMTFPFWNAANYVLYKHLIADFQE